MRMPLRAALQEFDSATREMGGYPSTLHGEPRERFGVSIRGGEKGF
jgi:hypothetical protein